MGSQELGIGLEGAGGNGVISMKGSSESKTLKETDGV